MIDLKDITEIYVYKEKCDLRMGIQGLSILAQELSNINEMRHKLFIFFGGLKNSIKILELDTDGWWLYQKKLSCGSFKRINELSSITKEELNLLLNGLSVDTYRKHKTPRSFINY